MASITINLPLVQNRVITVPNQKLPHLMKYIGVNQDDYDTDTEAAEALMQAIVAHIKKPVIRGRKRELAKNPNIDDVLVVTIVS